MRQSPAVETPNFYIRPYRRMQAEIFHDTLRPWMQACPPNATESCKGFLIGNISEGVPHHSALRPSYMEIAVSHISR